MRLVVALLLLAACADEGRPSEHDASNVVTITAEGLTFDGPTSVALGWTTFRFVNASTMTHVAILERMPDGIRIADQQREVAPVFQEGMNLLVEGSAAAASARFGELPKWFGKIVFKGGPGLTAPGRTSETAVQLEPGSYLLECYVKTNGIFHSYNPDPEVFGMVHELKVAGDPSVAPEPDAAVHVRISGEKEIEVEGTPTLGPQTVAVTFEDQKIHENFVGHDVHLVRLDEGTDVEALAAWMDWTCPDGPHRLFHRDPRAGTRRVDRGGTESPGQRHAEGILRPSRKQLSAAAAEESVQFEISAVGHRSRSQSPLGAPPLFDVRKCNALILGGAAMGFVTVASVRLGACAAEITLRWDGPEPGSRVTSARKESPCDNDSLS